MSVHDGGKALTIGGTKGTVRRPSKRPPRNMRVLVSAELERLDRLVACSNATSGEVVLTRCKVPGCLDSVEAILGAGDAGSRGSVGEELGVG